MSKSLLASWLEHLEKEKNVKDAKLEAERVESELDRIVIDYNLNGKRRDAVGSDRRAIFCWFCFYVKKMKVVEIGRLINRDHSTVSYASRRAERMAEMRDPIFIKNTVDIRRELLDLKNEKEWTRKREILF